MTSFATKLVLKKIMGEHTANKQGTEDPYFETVPATRLGVRTKKKLPKALPPGLTDREQQVLTKAKRRAYRLDYALGSFLGTRFGWGSVIGIIPGLGDVGDMLLALMVYRTICSVEPPVSSGMKMHMQLNIVFDFLIGLVPFVGDLVDAAYKCNTRNVVLLESELRKRGEKRIKGTAQANAADPSLADEFDYQLDERRANQQHGGPPPRYTSRKQSRRHRDDRRRDERDLEAGEGPAPPTPARTR